MMFWAIGAASIGGFVITALFAIVAIGQIAKRAAQRSARKRYASGLVAVGFSCLVIACAFCLARVLTDAETPPDILLSLAVSGRFSPDPCPEWGSVALLPGDRMPRRLVCYAYDAQQGGYRQTGP
jgi:glycerol uptake facilitator-like aquaporin